MAHDTCFFHSIANIVNKRHFDGTTAVTWTVIGVLGYAQILPNYLVCTFAMTLSLTTFIRRINDYIPYAELTALIATLQWILMPLVAYYVESPIAKYRMYVPQDIYFGYAIPGVAALNAALLAIRRGPDAIGSAFSLAYSPKVLRYVAGALIALGLISGLVSGRAPGSLAFVFHLLSQLTNVAVLILIYHRVPKSRYLLLLAILPLIFSAGRTAMFHSLLLWGGFFALFWLRSTTRSHSFRTQAIAVGIIGVLFVQFFKGAFREELKSNPGIGRFGAFVNVVSLDLVTDEGNWLNSVSRFNQGWIVSAVLRHVPAGEPIAGGETLQDAAVAAIFPRFILASKAKVGGRENFRRFTGLPINDRTSMGISPIGEAYANFGREGGIAFMLAWGVFLAIFINFLNRHATDRPLFQFLIPLILYQGIKAETEFLVIFNQFAKGFVVALLVYWGMKHYGKLGSLVRLRRVTTLPDPRTDGRPVE